MTVSDHLICGAAVAHHVVTGTTRVVNHVAHDLGFGCGHAVARKVSVVVVHFVSMHGYQIKISCSTFRIYDAHHTLSTQSTNKYIYRMVNVCACIETEGINQNDMLPSNFNKLKQSIYH